MSQLEYGGEDLAEQALSNLVNQFARPLDFLRELVQNSLDAGSPRVDIWLEYSPPESAGADGVLSIHVDDYGDGMDETILDNQLTRLFSSNKEDDLTKIGKFGIGFTSIFAIQPDAVLLRTGRHGESWELLFHADRSFDKVRIQEPVSGTQITLYKHMPSDRVEAFVREARWVLSYWCEHSDHPITFDDRTATRAPSQVTAAADPFAAFEAVEQTTRETVNSPLALGDSALALKLEEEDLLVGIGYPDRPRYGFYNGGLTLVNSTNPDVLGNYRDLAHLAFKVKCNALEHTLTRDNVLQDGQYNRVMGRLRAHATTLRDKLFERIAQASEAGEPLGPWHRHLANDVRVHGRELLVRRLDLPLFRDAKGNPLTLRKLEEQENTLGALLLVPKSERLAAELVATGLHLLDLEPETELLLRSFPRHSMIEYFRPPRTFVPADDRFMLPDLLERDELTSRERRLLDSAMRLIDKTLPKSLTVRLGDFGGSGAAPQDVLALEGPENGGLFALADDPWLSMPSFTRRRRCMLVNRHHDLFRALVIAASEDLPVAAFALAQALLIADGNRAAPPYDALLDLVVATYENEEVSP
ncbi:MAG: ATP-binding protein [Proteobacteria bacterium]|nr:ATP-binding protein [Pseudomonadota bacterium]